MCIVSDVSLLIVDCEKTLSRAREVNKMHSPANSESDRSDFVGSELRASFESESEQDVCSEVGDSTKDINELDHVKVLKPFEVILTKTASEESESDCVPRVDMTRSVVEVVKRMGLN